MHSMITPSMGSTAPVGSTVITSPVSIEDVHVGDVIAFHPPGRGSTSFVHRVVAIHRIDGRPALRTKGDINGSVDGWTITAHNLTGRAPAVVPDLAFLVQMLPLLLLGTLLIALLTHGTRAERRGPARLGLFSLLCSFLIYHFRPLAHLDVLTQTIRGGHGSATVVPTGALPLRVTAAGGTHTDLAPAGPRRRDQGPPTAQRTFHTDLGDPPHRLVVAADRRGSCRWVSACASHAPP